MEKQQIFSQLQNELTSKGFQFERTDFERPWGGFFVIEEEQGDKFIKLFYPEERAKKLTKNGSVSPRETHF